MSEIVRWQERPSLSLETVSEAAEFANKIATTDFVPSALRGKPAAVLAAIMSGNELGIGPMQSLNKIHVVDGRPTLSGELMRALVLSKGHELWIDENTNTRVSICGRRAGTDHISKVTWTLDDAKRAGLAQKQVWQRYPRAMLTARATGELCRSMFPDVLGGISYTPEEVRDGFYDESPEVIEIDENGAVVEMPDPKPITRKAMGAKAKTSGRASKEPKERPPKPSLATSAADGEQPHPTRTTAQKIAMRAEQFGLDRSKFALAASFGQTDKCSELTEEQALEAYENVLAVGEGRAKLIDDLDGAGPAIIFVDQASASFKPLTVSDVANALDAEVIDTEVVEERGQWDADQWREFLRDHGVKLSEVIKAFPDIKNVSDLVAAANQSEIAEWIELRAESR